MTRSLIISLATILIANSFTAQARPFRVDDEFTLDIPVNWTLADSTGTYPFHLTEIDQAGELFVFRSAISAEETIDDELMLRYSVEAVMDAALPEMADRELIRSAGYLEGDHASFLIDFVAIDSTTEAQVYHRMQGILYRMHDGSQALFTLWAKSSPENFSFLEPAFEAIIESFEYIGPRQKEIFVVDDSRRLWYLLFATGGLAAAAVYIGRLRQQRIKLSYSSNLNFWKCSCARLNHNSRPTCRRCGRARADC